MATRTDLLKKAFDPKVVTAADIKADTNAALGEAQKADAERRVAALKAETDQRTAELVKADGRSERDRAFGELIQIVRHAETLRFEGQASIEARSLNDEIERALDDGLAQQTQREQVDSETIRRAYEAAGKLLGQFETWMLQRGLIEDGGS